MPPIQKVSKEAILEIGYVLVKEGGIDSINSRQIAKRLGCSTQPIFSQFTNMEELKQAIHDYACKKFEDDILEGVILDSFFKSSYLKLIYLAREKKHIFHLLFLSPYCLGENFLSARMNFKTNQRIWEEIKLEYQLDNSECSSVMERISLFIHGIATLIATSGFSYTDEQIIDMVERTMKDMINGVLERKRDDE